MDIDNKGKGKETEKVAEEGSTNVASMSHYEQYFLVNNYTSISDESKIELGATHDPDLLPDHHGEYFQHPKAHLIQQDYHHVNKNLIAPWKTYEVLNTGTILLINAIMNCWKMKINEDSYHKVSFSYHIYNFIKVDFSFPRYINLVFTACE